MIGALILLIHLSAASIFTWVVAGWAAEVPEPRKRLRWK